MKYAMNCISIFAIIMLLLIVQQNAFSFQIAQGESNINKKYSYDVEKLLSGPSREDFPWKISISEPQRMLEQRYLINISVAIPYSSIGKTGRRDLYFIAKVAKENVWLPGNLLNHVDAKQAFNNSDIIAVAGSIYLRPGKYNLAVGVYDMANAQANVARKQVMLPILKPEPLMEIDEGLPEIEFLSSKDHFYDCISTWLSTSRGLLTIKSKRPLWIDIIANLDQTSQKRLMQSYDDSTLSKSADNLELRRLRANMYDEIDNRTALQLSSLLSRFKAINGRTRITIMNAVNMQIFVDREDARSFDWRRAQNAFSADLDSGTVDAGLLSSYTPSSFFSEKISTILDEKNDMSGSNSPIKVIIIVGRPIVFSNEKRLKKVFPRDPKSARFFYFRIQDRSIYADTIDDMLKAAHSRRIAFNLLEIGVVHPPTEFRKKIQSVIHTLERLK